MSSTTTAAKAGKKPQPSSVEEPRTVVFGMPTRDQIEDPASPFYIDEEQRADYLHAATDRALYDALGGRKHNTPDFHDAAIDRILDDRWPASRNHGVYSSARTRNPDRPTPEAFLHDHHVSPEGVYAWTVCADHAAHQHRSRTYAAEWQTRHDQSHTCWACGTVDPTTTSRDLIAPWLPKVIARSALCDPCTAAALTIIGEPKTDAVRTWLNQQTPGT